MAPLAPCRCRLVRPSAGSASAPPPGLVALHGQLDRRWRGASAIRCGGFDGTDRPRADGTDTRRADVTDRRRADGTDTRRGDVTDRRRAAIIVGIDHRRPIAIGAPTVPPGAVAVSVTVP